ncbi:MAG TPA: hypothetical protein VL100_04400 [Croceibacterium sp.]|nr:hypothetical protein [Croceibacterium sp.]
MLLFGAGAVAMFVRRRKAKAADKLAA